MVLCMVFTHGFRHDGFWSMVLDALTCINMYCNIERNIMKNQAGSPSFGIQGKISMHICLCVMLSHCLFEGSSLQYVQAFDATTWSSL